MYAKFAAAADTPRSASSARTENLARVYRAMTQHPEFVAGEGRFCTELMDAYRGQLAGKLGADGCYDVGIRACADTMRLDVHGAIGIAVKVDDGNYDILYVVITGKMDEIRRRTKSPPYIHEHDTVQVAALETTTDPICGYFSDNPDYTAACASPSTCSTPSGGKSWGCCYETSCYIPATCEDASAPDCGGTAASLCPYSPIMKCTYGASSLCVHFIYQTGFDDNAKVTSWGCGVTPTTYIIGPLEARQTSHHTASATAWMNDETDSNSGLSKDATIILAVVLPVLGLAILIAGVMLFIKQRKKRAHNNTSEPRQVGNGVRSQMQPTTVCATVVAVPPYEMGDNVSRPELDGRGIHNRTD
ncbi:unnamed protein product [Fusarium equiseti]|uniref:Uncharacterized protein n=1 Tax=Fusarium equiseti TaxID=61235 RepID=A0A8J2ISE5_FUSEQ|nr:unnamed protein product [Fusarium equiseti]